MRRAHMRGALLLVALVTVAIALPGAGQTKPPETDGSVYSWFGAATLSVDVKPWGGGYVRSDPYLIDCPMACIRPFESGREVKLTAYMTPGHTFKGWEGPCAGQGNPCTIKVSGAMEVTAVLEGQFVPPKPPPPPPGSPPAPPSVVNPALMVVDTQGECPECFTTVVSGTGFHPNSSISITFVFSTPTTGDQEFLDAETSDDSGSWTQGFYEPCIFDGGPYVGPVEADVIATDAEGATATGHSSGVCPEQPAPPAPSG
jgi:hypothetical protein